jgi:hypothetical protein
VFVDATESILDFAGALKRFESLLQKWGVTPKREGNISDLPASEGKDSQLVIKRVFFFDLTREPLQYSIGSHFLFHL